MSNKPAVYADVLKASGNAAKNKMAQDSVKHATDDSNFGSDIAARFNPHYKKEDK